MSDAATARSKALLRAWLWCEGCSPGGIPGGATGFERGHARLQHAERGTPQVPPEDSWLRLWASLPAGARDLIALRVLGGLSLERIAELQDRPLARIQREWLLLGRRLATRQPDWPAALRAAFLSVSPAPRAGLGMRLALGTAAALCFLGAAFAPQLHYALLLDEAQQRLQAPPAAPPPVVEQVPLSAPEFALWLDTVEFGTLQSLDFLLWRLRESGGEVVLAEAGAPLIREAALPVVDSPARSETGAPVVAVLAPPELSALQPWAAQWPLLQPAQRAELEARARQWEALDSEGRARFEQRAEAFRALPPLSRAELRDRHARWLAFDEVTRATLIALEQGHAAAGPGDQAALRERFLALPEAVRRGLIAGKTAELAELAREAFAFVPAEEREATLELLRGLGEAEHGLLRRMARRLDPAARESLRSELLAAEPDARAALVRARAAAVGVRAPN